MYKFTAALVLFTFVAVALSILTECKSELLLGVFVLIPVFWTLWIACVVSHKEKTGIAKLVLLWVLIDLVVLLYSRWAFGSFHGVDPKGGAEIAWLIEFSPMILPMILFAFIPLIGTGLSAVADGASFSFLPAGSVGVLRDWLCGSIISAIPSITFIYLRLYWQVIRKYARFN